MNACLSDNSNLPVIVQLPISLRAFFSTSFITYRRLLLDCCLCQARPYIEGNIVDLGGKKQHKRGQFRPTANSQITYVNLDESTEPDIVSDIQCVPLEAGIADCVICTETIEHVKEPGKCVDECHRLLKPGGVLILSVPFLYPIHADPFDFYRYTPEALTYLCRHFSSVSVSPMGGFFGVLGMFWESYVKKHNYRLIRLTKYLARVLQVIDSKNGQRGSKTFTTGYFLIAKK